MDRNQATKLLATILTTVAEVKQAPAGLLYTGLISVCTLDEFQTIVGIAERSGLITRSHHVLSITAEGAKVAEKIEGALAEARKLAS